MLEQAIQCPEVASFMVSVDLFSRNSTVAVISTDRPHVCLEDDLFMGLCTDSFVYLAMDLVCT